MTTEIEREFSLMEILVKTNYQITVSKESSFQSNPIAYGTGFFLNYKTHLFFITADHNIHLDDHELNERTGIDNYVGVFNNISNRDNFSTIISPIGGFYFMESYDLSKKDLNPQLFDVAISMVDRNRFEAPFYTDENLVDTNGKQLISPKESKFEFSEIHITEPSKDDSYFIYGKIKPVMKGLFLHRESTFKEDLTYVATYGNYLLLNTVTEIASKSDWAGLSGSPVLNQYGNCVGVLCSVNEGTKSVFVKPFSKITPFLDTIILQEKLALANQP